MRGGWLQRCDQLLRSRRGIEPAVGLVFRLSGEIELRHEAIKPAVNGKVNVRRADIALGRRVSPRLYGPQAVAPGVIRCQQREAFEIRIERCWIGVSWMAILAIGIGLPNFDARSTDRFSRTGQHAAHDIEQLTSRFCRAVIRPREVACQIGTLGHWIERPDNLRLRHLQTARTARCHWWAGSHCSHCGSLMFASLTTFAQCATWPRIASPNSAAVPPAGSAPIFSRAVRIFGSARTLLMALFSRAVTSAGVSRFTPKPIQSAVTRSGKSASATDGISLRT